MASMTNDFLIDKNNFGKDRNFHLIFAKNLLKIEKRHFTTILTFPKLGMKVCVALASPWRSECTKTVAK